jgi:hypothetical protein
MPSRVRWADESAVTPQSGPPGLPPSQKKAPQRRRGYKALTRDRALGSVFELDFRQVSGPNARAGGRTLLTRGGKTKGFVCSA